MTTTDPLDITDDDVTVLCEALEAWETKDFAGAMMGDILEMVMADKGDPLAKTKMAEAREKEKALRKREERMRKERSIVLRAKLLQWRAARGVDQISREVSAVR